MKPTFTGQIWIFILAGILAVLLVSSARAQSVAISPYSFSLWGMSDGIVEVSARDFNVGFHYFMPTSMKEMGYMGESVSLKPGIAVSYAFRWRVFEFGPILFDRQFPINGASRLNLFLDVGFDIGKVRVSYRHLSNGFGILNKVNPGVDSLTLRVRV